MTTKSIGQTFIDNLIAERPAIIRRKLASATALYVSVLHELAMTERAALVEAGVLEMVQTSSVDGLEILEALQ